MSQPDLGEPSGMHLEYISVNHWRLTGRHTVVIKMVETADHKIRWDVSIDDISRGRWSSAELALAQAYTLAK